MVSLTLDKLTRFFSRFSKCVVTVFNENTQLFLQHVTTACYVTKTLV